MWKLWLWLKESISGITRNFLFNMFATFLAFLSFFVLAFWLIIGINIEYSSEKVEENVQIALNLKDSADNYDEIKSDISNISGVKDYEFISKKEAYEKMEKDLGDRKEMLNNLDFNPFPASFKIDVKNPENIKKVAKKLETLGVHKSINYGENYVNELFETTDKIKHIIFAILIVMIVSSGAMIYVSIRMNILNRNKELEIKDLIGAGKLNTRIPFIIEGILLTAGSALAILILTYFSYDFIVDFIQTRYPGTSFAPRSDVMSSMTPVLLGVSILIGFISSFLSTQKYLKRH